MRELLSSYANVIVEPAVLEYIFTTAEAARVGRMRCGCVHVSGIAYAFFPKGRTSGGQWRGGSQLEASVGLDSAWVYSVKFSVKLSGIDALRSNDCDGILLIVAKQIHLHHQTSSL